MTDFIKNFTEATKQESFKKFGYGDMADIAINFFTTFVCLMMLFCLIFEKFGREMRFLQRSLKPIKKKSQSKAKQFRINVIILN